MCLLIKINCDCSNMLNSSSSCMKPHSIASIHLNCIPSNWIRATWSLFAYQIHMWNSLHRMRINEFRSAEPYIVRCSVFAFAFQIECSDQSVLFFFYYLRLNWIENSITWIWFLGVGFQSNCFVIWQFNCIIFRSHSNINWNMFCCNWMYNEKLWFDFGFSKIQVVCFWRAFHVEHEPCSK